MRTRPRVLVLNGSEDLLEVLSEVLEMAGFEVQAVLIPDAERGRVDLREIFRRFAPRAVVFDLSLPYKRSWDYLQHVKAQPEAQAIPFLITTANARAARHLIGPDALELVLKPYDLAELTRRVAHAVGGALDSGHEPGSEEPETRMH